MSNLITFIFYILIITVTSSCVTHRSTQGHQILDVETAQIKKNISTKNDIVDLFGLPSFTSLGYGNKTWYYVFDHIEQKSFSTNKKINRDILIINFNKTGNIVTNFSKKTQLFSGKYNIDQEHTKPELKTNIFYRYINGLGKSNKNN